VVAAKTKAAAAKAEPEEQPIAETPEAAVELTVRPNSEADAFKAMDRLDEVQILDALEGRPSDTIAYSFKSGGKLQTGLSYAGVAEVVRTLNTEGHTAIRVSPDVQPLVQEIVEEDDNGEPVTYIQVTVYAEDTRNGGGNYGSARQAKFLTYRDKSRKPQLDSFAFVKALSKAQRNAMSPLTPMIFREALVAKALDNPGRVKELRIGMGDPQAELPPPLTDDRAQELKTEIRAVYKEIRAIDPAVLPPGRFNVQFRRTEHEHAAMEEFLEGLRSQLAHLRGESS
jgi:hypothetical protein